MASYVVNQPGGGQVIREEGKPDIVIKQPSTTSGNIQSTPSSTTSQPSSGGTQYYWYQFGEGSEPGKVIVSTSPSQPLEGRVIATGGTGIGGYERAVQATTGSRPGDIHPTTQGAAVQQMVRQGYTLNIDTGQYERPLSPGSNVITTKPFIDVSTAGFIVAEAQQRGYLTPTMMPESGKTTSFDQTLTPYMPYKDVKTGALYEGVKFTAATPEIRSSITSALARSGFALQPTEEKDYYRLVSYKPTQEPLTKKTSEQITKTFSTQSLAKPSATAKVQEAFGVPTLSGTFGAAKLTTPTSEPTKYSKIYDYITRGSLIGSVEQQTAWAYEREAKERLAAGKPVQSKDELQYRETGLTVSYKQDIRKSQQPFIEALPEFLRPDIPIYLNPAAILSPVGVLAGAYKPGKVEQYQVGTIKQGVPGAVSELTYDIGETAKTASTILTLPYLYGKAVATEHGTKKEKEEAISETLTVLPYATQLPFTVAFLAQPVLEGIMTPAAPVVATTVERTATFGAVKVGNELYVAPIFGTSKADTISAMASYYAGTSKGISVNTIITPYVKVGTIGITTQLAPDIYAFSGARALENIAAFAGLETASQAAQGKFEPAKIAKAGLYGGLFYEAGLAASEAPYGLSLMAKDIGVKAAAPRPSVMEGGYERVAPEPLRLTYEGETLRTTEVPGGFKPKTGDFTISYTKEVKPAEITPFEKGVATDITKTAAERGTIGKYTSGKEALEMITGKQLTREGIKDITSYEYRPIEKTGIFDISTWLVKETKVKPMGEAGISIPDITGKVQPFKPIDAIPDIFKQGDNIPKEFKPDNIIPDEGVKPPEPKDEGKGEGGKGEGGKGGGESGGIFGIPAIPNILGAVFASGQTSSKGGGEKAISQKGSFPASIADLLTITLSDVAPIQRKVVRKKRVR